MTLRLRNALGDRVRCLGEARSIPQDKISLVMNKQQNNGPGPADIVLCNNLLHYYSEGSHKTIRLRVPSYYKIISMVGEGAYGVVVSALNTKTNEMVAIKKIVNLFQQNGTYQKRILREVKIMHHVADYCHENILPLIDLIPPLNYKSFRDLYIVSPLMDFSLKRITKKLETPKDRMVKYIMYQLFRGLHHLHRMNIVHRDIKPGNILLNKQLDVKICDFGLSRGLDEGAEVSCTYVATRWYRAPELCLGWKQSSFPVDIWSMGCIFAELLTRDSPHVRQTGRKVLLPGTCHLNQIVLIFQLLQRPPIRDLCACEDGKRWVKDNIPQKSKRFDLARIFPYVSNDAIDLLRKLLHIDPRKRLTAKQAMESKYLREIHEEVMEFQKNQESMKDEEEDEDDDGFENQYTIPDFDVDNNPYFGDGKKSDVDEKIDKVPFMFRFDDANFVDVKKELYQEIRNLYREVGFRGRIFMDKTERNFRSKDQGN